MYDCIFNILTKMYNHHYNQFRTFTLLQNETLYLLPVTPNCAPNLPLSTTQPQTTSCLFSVSIDLFILDVSYKWNCTVCSLMWLVFSLRIFSIFMHLVAYVTISFYCWVTFYCMDISYFIMYGFINWWTFELFQNFDHYE